MDNPIEQEKKNMMKKLLVLIFCVCGMNAQESLQDLIKKGEYQSVLKQYQEQDNKSVQDWYNMGNCAFQEEKLNLAYACWFIAAGHAARGGQLSVQQAAEHNIDFIKGEYEDLPQPLLSLEAMSLCRGWSRAIPFSIWCLVSVLLFLLLGIYVIKNGIRRKIFIIGCILWILLLIPLVNEYYLLSFNRGMVIIPSGELKQGPGDSYSKRGSVSCGEQVYVSQELQGWYLIEGCNGKGCITNASVVTTPY